MFLNGAARKKEKTEWINGLAEIYKKQGLHGKQLVKEIQAKTGLGERTVYEYLSKNFKEKRTEYFTQSSRVPVSQRIEKAFPES